MGAHDGRVALVTGGALGIGQESARAFVAEGATDGPGSAITRRMTGSDLPVDGGFAALSGFTGERTADG